MGFLANRHCSTRFSGAIMKLVWIFVLSFSLVMPLQAKPEIIACPSLNVQTLEVHHVRPYAEANLEPVQDAVKDYKESYTFLFILVNLAFVGAVLAI